MTPPVIAAEQSVRLLEADSAAAATLSGFAFRVAAKRAQVVGTVSHSLHLARVPARGTVGRPARADDARKSVVTATGVRLGE